MTQAQLASIEHEIQRVEELENLAAVMDLPNTPPYKDRLRADGDGDSPNSDVPSTDKDKKDRPEIDVDIPDKGKEDRPDIDVGVPDKDKGKGDRPEIDVDVPGGGKDNRP
jgi:hypothetical protein